MKRPIILLIPILLLASSLLSSFIIYHLELSETEQNIRDDALSHVNLDISRLQNVLYNYLPETGTTYEEARLNLSVTAMDPHINQLFVTDENEVVLVSNRYAWEGQQATQIGRFDSETSRQVQQKRKPELFFLPNKTNLLHGYYPVILQLESAQGLPVKRVGTLFIEYDISTKLNKAIYGLNQRAKLLGGLVLFTSLLIALLLHILVTRRLGTLSNAAMNLAAGDLNTRAPIKGNDELTQLGKAFNEMAERIKDDISRRERAERDLRELNETLEERIKERTAMLEEAQRIGRIGNWHLDIDTGLLTVSNEVYRIFGYETHEVEDTYEVFINTIHDDDIPLVEAALQNAIQENSKYSIDYRVPLKNKSLHWIHAEGIPKYNSEGKAISLSGTVQDITDHKLNEERLIKAKEEAERANHAKSDFLSRMSHELRTPMNAILGFSQLLEMNEPSEKQHSFINEILTAGHHLLNLINELLDLARIESGRMTILLESIDIDSIIQQSIHMIDPLLSEKNITLHNNVSANQFILADNTRLCQVLVNLLSNAAKYNRDHGSISIDYQLLDNNMVRLSITDTGLGISKRDLSILFNPFERLHADHSDVEGAGIGLALSKQLVELMGGHIGVHSEPGKGSCFWLELPTASTEDKRAMNHDIDETGSRSANNCKVLYVEDNSANLKVIESLLNHYPNFQLLSATNGSYGLELAQRYLPNVILLDIHLPDRDGFQVLECLRKDKSTAQIPVIALSADAMPCHIERGLSAGFDEYLTKPVNLQKLLEALSKYGNIPH